MFDYKFVQVQIGALNGKPKENYEEIIKNYAKEGWRLHTFSPLPFAAGGQATSIQIIFEKEVNQ
ncbi:DUF4177 domain-containing protein [Bacillus methanolicus]|uniref:DUF4177 domain-containing protein n=1 Tax=Bacillus methanolicus TaxID=1471 RepID=UPI00238036FC|nr:DUF4177 domain-containing protein [Bacillus methanolicus]